MSSVLRQFRALWRVMLAIYIPIFCVLGLLILVRLKTGIHISYFTADPAQTMGAPFYVGVVSNLGVFLWCACASICYFSAALLLKQAKEGEWPSFILSAAVITSFLLLDDAFQAHEIIFPEFLRVPEKAVIGMYGVIIALFLVRFRRTILKTEYFLLSLALGFYGGSLLLDFMSHSKPGHFLFEDGLKLSGIVTWLTYFARVSWKAIEDTSRQI